MHFQRPRLRNNNLGITSLRSVGKGISHCQLNVADTVEIKRNCDAKQAIKSILSLRHVLQIVIIWIRMTKYSSSRLKCLEGKRRSYKYMQPLRRILAPFPCSSSAPIKFITSSFWMRFRWHHHGGSPLDNCYHLICRLHWFNWYGDAPSRSLSSLCRPFDIFTCSFSSRLFYFSYIFAILLFSCLF